MTNVPVGGYRSWERCAALALAVTAGAALFAWRGGDDALAVGFLLLALATVAFTSGRSHGLIVTASCVVIGFGVLELRLGHVALFVLNGTLVATLVALLRSARNRVIEREVARLAANGAREQSDRRFSRMFALSPLPIVVVRSADRIAVAVNDAFIECFGWTRDEIIGRRPLHFGIYSDP